jgi:hypothetical protein
MVERLSERHPNLIFLRNELLRAKNTKDAERGRAAVVEFFDDNRLPKSKIWESSEASEGSEALESYLHKPCSGLCGRLFLLEDIATNYVETFGHHFCIDPSIFARQLRTNSWESSDEASSPTPLQSTSDHESIFSLCYPELVKFLGSEVQIKESLSCHSNVYRYINAIRQKSFFDGIGIVHRRFSFWSRKHDSGFWDDECAILLGLILSGR